MYNTSDDLICLLIMLVILCVVCGVGGWLLERFPRIGDLLARIGEGGNDIISALFYPDPPEVIPQKYPQATWRIDPDGKITVLSVRFKPEQQKDPARKPRS